MACKKKVARKKELRKKEAANKLISEINSEEVIDGLLPIDSPNIEAKMLIENHEVAGTILNLKRT